MVCAGPGRQRRLNEQTCRNTASRHPLTAPPTALHPSPRSSWKVPDADYSDPRGGSWAASHHRVCDSPGGCNTLGGRTRHYLRGRSESNADVLAARQASSTTIADKKKVINDESLWTLIPVRCTCSIYVLRESRRMFYPENK